MCERWENCSSELAEFRFDLEEFQALAKATYDWLVKFFVANLLPLKIVHLLLSIRDFANRHEYVSEVSEAAVLLANTLCDVEDYCGISGHNPVLYEISPENQWLKVDGYTQSITINTETFDLTELIEDIKNS